MKESWLELAGQLLRPARAELPRCRAQRARYLAARRAQAVERGQAISACEARIERARAGVFAASDGVVPSLMTDLERQWRDLSQGGRDAELMELWASLAPASWIDRKRWRDSDPTKQLEAAVALAADVDGVEAAEAAVEELRAVLARWHVSIGARLHWHLCSHDFIGTPALLEGPLRDALEALSECGNEAFVVGRARSLAEDVGRAVVARVPRRPTLASAVAHAASVDFIWRAAALDAGPNPVLPLFQIWRLGYALSAIDESGVSLQIPPLPNTQHPEA